jgi:hypothetical protein
MQQKLVCASNCICLRYFKSNKQDISGKNREYLH